MEELTLLNVEHGNYVRDIIDGIGIIVVADYFGSDVRHVRVLFANKKSKVYYSFENYLGLRLSVKLEDLIEPGDIVNGHIYEGDTSIGHIESLITKDQIKIYAYKEKDFQNSYESYLTMYDH